MFHTGKPEEADKEQNETMDCLKYVLDGNISLRVLRKNHLSHVCIVKGGFYAIHEYLYRSHRMDFSPEVSIVEATETGSRTRQGAALWSRHSLGTRWVDSSNPRDGMIDRSMNLALPREENESRVFRHSHIADSDSSISVVSFLCVRHPCLQ